MKADIESEGGAKPAVGHQDCFVIMPISEVDGYPPNHFRHVYDHIIKPSCSTAGYNAIRADDVQATNLIHLDIIRKIIDTPVAVCDLSTRNPNVLFELGIRQAFDKPVVLIQEAGTPKIFDIGPLRCLDYSRDMRYHEVIETQRKLSEAIQETVASSSDAKNVNSIVKLLSLSESAKIPDIGGNKEAMEFDLLRSEIQQLKKIVEDLAVSELQKPRVHSAISTEISRLMADLNKVIHHQDKIDYSTKIKTVNNIIDDCVRLNKHVNNRDDVSILRVLMERAEAFKEKTIKDYDDIPF